LRDKLRVEKSSKSPHQIDPKVPLRISPPKTRLTLALHLSKPLTRTRGLLVCLLSGWKKRSTLGVIAMDISKWIVPTEEPSPLGRWRRSKLLRKKLVKKSLKRRITLLVTTDGENYWYFEEFSMPKRFLLTLAKGSKSFTLVSLLLMEVFAPMWLL